VSALVPIDTLGKEIKARIEAGDKAMGKAEDHYLAAGLQLAEARRRVADDGGSFRAFLDNHGIGRSRAYDILAVTDGRKTFDGIRAKAAERAAKHAATNREARLSVSNGQSQEPLPGGAPTDDRAMKEIEALKKKLAKAEAALEDERGKARFAQAEANMAIEREKKTASERMFLISDKDTATKEIESLKKEHERIKKALVDAKGRLSIVEGHAESVKRQRDELDTKYRFASADKDRLELQLDELQDELERLREDVDLGSFLIHTYYSSAVTWREVLQTADRYNDDAIEAFSSEVINREDLAKMVELAAYGRLNDYYSWVASSRSYDILEPDWRRETREFHDRIRLRELAIRAA